MIRALRRFAGQLRVFETAPDTDVPAIGDGFTIYRSQELGARLAWIQARLAALPSCRLRGLVWWQGEADVTGTDWDTSLATLIGNLRTDLVRPALPIVFVRLPTPPSFPTYTEEQFAAFLEQQDSAASSIVHCAQVSYAATFPAGEYQHVDGASLTAIGNLAADALKG